MHHFQFVLRSRGKAGYILLLTMAKLKRTQKDRRELGQLISIGPAMLRDFKLLGVNSVAKLARQNPEKLYAKLGRVTGQRQDICVLDTFRAGVEQARNPRLPAEQCQWWYWSRRRKVSNKGQAS
jgi:nucleotidyltransferase/DNA polymerase involved in DNA repair